MEYHEIFSHLPLLAFTLPLVLPDPVFQLQSHIEDVRKLFKKISMAFISLVEILRLKTNIRIAGIPHRNSGNPMVLGRYVKTKGK